LIKVNFVPNTEEDPEDTFSASKFDIEFKRSWTPFIFTAFLPSTLFVIVSWISFAIQVDAGERGGVDNI
jgi:hypothetical protein